MKERARVSGKTSFVRLSVEDAVEALGLEADLLRRRIQAHAIPHKRDEKIIEGLEAQVTNLRPSSEPPQEPREPTEPFKGTSPPQA